MASDPIISNLFGLAKTAQIAGNNEEALGYFNRVLEADPTHYEAWIGKGKAAGWQSTLANVRTPEAIIAFSHAIATAPDGRKATVTAEVVSETNAIVVALYGMARRHLEEFVAVDSVWAEYLNQVSFLLDALDQVRSWEPDNRTTLENIVHLCKDNIEGITYRNFDNTPGAWHLAPQYEAQIRARLDAAVQSLRALDPAYAPPAIQKKQAENCFVVTATMGNPNHPTVSLMRRYRDERLASSSLGRRFITIYYRHGPSVASFVGKTTARRMISYAFIVRPAATMAKLLLGK